MADTYTTNKAFVKPSQSSYVSTWDIPINNNLNNIDTCLGGVTEVNLTDKSDYTLTLGNIRNTTIKLTGALVGIVYVRLEAGSGGLFTFINATTGSSGVLVLAWTSGANTYVINRNNTQIMYADGSNNTWNPATPQTGDITYAAPVTVDLTAFNTPPNTNYSISNADAKNQFFNITGSTSATITITFPTGYTPAGLYFFRNIAASSANISVVLGASSLLLDAANISQMLVCTGTAWRKAAPVYT